MIRRIVLVLFCVLLFIGQASATWWNESWDYKMPVFINNTGNATVLTNYQVFLNITYNANMQAEFKDIRVVNDTSGASVPYWIESKVNSSYANIWFNASSIPASVWTNTTYYLYYGNAAVSDGGNGNATFQFFDDFNDASIDTNKWVYSGNVTESSGKITLVRSTGMLQTKNSFSDTSYIVEYNATATFADATAYALGTGFTDANQADGNEIIFFFSGDTKFVVYTHSPTWANLYLGNLGDYVKGTYYNFRIIKNVNNYTWFKNNIQIGGTFVGAVNTPSYIVMPSYWGDTSDLGTLIYDLFYIRKYIPIEPTATLGTEETPPSGAEPAQVQVIWWE